MQIELAETSGSITYAVVSANEIFDWTDGCSHTTFVTQIDLLENTSSCN